MTERDDIVLRSPTDEAGRRAFYEPLAIAFGEEIVPGEIDAERDLLELDRLINAFDGERSIASSGSLSMRLTVPGGADVPAAGITAVGVVPDARRRGVLRRMMDWLLADAAARGEPLAILWASEAAIYQKFGFGMATQVSSFEVDKARIVFREPLPPRDDVRIRMVDVDEATRIAPRIYERIRAVVPGSMVRPEVMWRNLLLGDAEWMRAGNGPKYRIVLEVDGEPRGFAVYRFKDDYGPQGPASTVHVIEVQALDPETEQRLWEWLCSMDLTTTVRALRQPVPNPLQLRLREPRRLGLMVGDGLWLRFVDVAAALAARTYAGEGSVVLELTDELLPANAGRWEIRVGGSDGSATVLPATRPADLSLDVSALAAVYLGSWRFRDLAAAARVTECRPGALFDADRLFATERAPYANTMF
jgi:predicted acetyltransferase